METLSKHFREIARAAFERHGFAQADVVSNWGDIVGEELARHSAPERIRWPPGGEQEQKSGGTLVIRAAPGRALDLQYEAPRIIARINSFFGFAAVLKLKVVQAPGLLRPGPRPQPALAEKPLDNPQLNAIDAEPLRAALQRLGQAVALRQRSSPHPK